MRILASLLIIFTSLSIYANDITIATWNIGAPEAEEIPARKQFLEDASTAMQANIYILQELTHLNQLKEFAAALNLENVDMTMSNFDIFYSIKYFALEVGVISTIPIVSVTEYDPKNSNTALDKEPYFYSEIGSDPNLTQILFDFDPIANEDLSSIENTGIPSGSRGFLRVELENGMIIYAVHLKSSGLGICRAISEPLYASQELIVKNSSIPVGHPLIESIKDLEDEYLAFYTDQSSNEKAVVNETRDSARKREYMAMKVVSVIAQDDLNDSTVIVAGDMNTPWEEDCVRGNSYEEDTKVSNLTCPIPRSIQENPVFTGNAGEKQCDARDGFDDTHGIFSGDNDFSVSMRALAENLNHRTYVSEGFVESPIDHIYVIGKDADKFSDAIIPQDALDAYDPQKPKVWGTDHFPLVTTFSE